MRTWFLLLGSLLVWAAQFFILYIIASIYGSSTIARLSTIAVTLACLAANCAILWTAFHRQGRDEFDRWIRLAALTGAIFSVIAVLWQGLPAIIGV